MPFSYCPPLPFYASDVERSVRAQIISVSMVTDAPFIHAELYICLTEMTKLMSAETNLYCWKVTITNVFTYTWKYKTQHYEINAFKLLPHMAAVKVCLSLCVYVRYKLPATSYIQTGVKDACHYVIVYTDLWWHYQLVMSTMVSSSASLILHNQNVGICVPANKNNNAFQQFWCNDKNCFCLRAGKGAGFKSRCFSPDPRTQQLFVSTINSSSLINTFSRGKTVTRLH